MKTYFIILGWLSVFSVGCVFPAQAATGSDDRGEVVKVSRHIHLCAGICPDYDVSVEANGSVQVKSSVGMPFEQKAAYHVSAADAARVRSILLSLGHSQDGVICPHPEWEGGYSAPENDTEVRLITQNAPPRLIACDNKQDARFLAAVHQALAILNLNEMGHPTER
jgi:hypothetical protein